MRERRARANLNLPSACGNLLLFLYAALYGLCYIWRILFCRAIPSLENTTVPGRCNRSGCCYCSMWYHTSYQYNFIRTCFVGYSLVVAVDSFHPKRHSLRSMQIVSCYASSAVLTCSVSTFHPKRYLLIFNRPKRYLFRFIRPTRYTLHPKSETIALCPEILTPYLH